MIILRDFLTRDELDSLLLWANYCIDNDLLPVNPHAVDGNRFSTSTYSLSPPSEVDSVRKRIEQRFCLEGRDEDVNIGFRLMYHKPGVVIENHQDAMSRGNGIARVNIMLKKPASGGLPTFENGEEHDVDPGCLWAFVGDKEIHGCSRSSEDRIILSFGYEIDDEYEMSERSLACRGDVVLTSVK